MENSLCVPRFPAAARALGYAKSRSRVPLFWPAFEIRFLLSAACESERASACIAKQAKGAKMWHLKQKFTVVTLNDLVLKLTLHFALVFTPVSKSLSEEIPRPQIYGPRKDVKTRKIWRHLLTQIHRALERQKMCELKHAKFKITAKYLIYYVNIQLLLTIFYTT